MRIYKDIAYGEHEKQKYDMYLPDTNEFFTIVYFHGGGLMKGNKYSESKEEIASSFVKNGYGFISVGYRLYTDGAKYPDYLTDAANAIALICKTLKEYGGNERLLVSGQSAGAWMSLMLCLNKEYLSNVDIDPLSIEGWIIDSAQTTLHFNVLNKEKGLDKKLQRIDEFAPLYYVSQENRFTKMLLLFYENDMPCRPEQNKLFYKAICNIDPSADIEYRELQGKHCHGSTHKDEDGEYAYVKESLQWMAAKGLIK